jgi:hypothetical protein
MPLGCAQRPNAGRRSGAASSHANLRESSMKLASFMFRTLLLSGVSAAALANSSFQQTCSNIAFSYSGNSPSLQAVCLRTNGTPNATSLVIQGISNQNGVLTATGGASTFQQSCGNIQVSVTTSTATLTAFCRTTGGASNATSIPLNGISNQNGNLTY